MPENNLEAYRQQATTFGTVAKEHGALSYREFRGDDLDDSFKVPDGQIGSRAGRGAPCTTCWRPA